MLPGRLTQNAGNVHLHFGPARVVFRDKWPRPGVEPALIQCDLSLERFSTTTNPHLSVLRLKPG